MVTEVIGTSARKDKGPLSMHTYKHTGTHTLRGTHTYGHRNIHTLTDRGTH